MSSQTITSVNVNMEDLAAQAFRRACMGKGIKISAPVATTVTTAVEPTVEHEVLEVVVNAEKTEIKRKASLSIDSPSFFELVCGRNGIRISKPVEKVVEKAAGATEEKINVEEKVTLVDGLDGLRELDQFLRDGETEGSVVGGSETSDDMPELEDLNEDSLIEE